MSKLHIILDIDETFVQFGDEEDWQTIVPDSEKGKYYREGGFIFRPHFKEFFQGLKEIAASINLWTLSEREYAQDVKRLIEKNTNVKIKNVWCDEDATAAEDEGYPGQKNLQWIWDQGYGLQQCNTLLIDDLPANTQHATNVRNGIQLVAFHPMGEKISGPTKKGMKAKHRIRSGPYHPMDKDDILMKVLDKVKSIKVDCGKPPLEASTLIGGGRRKTYRRKGRKLTRKSRK